MKKLLQTIATTAATLLASVVPVSAGPLLPNIADITTATGLGATEPAAVVAMLIKTALLLLGTIALVLIIYGGFMWMTARGNEEQVTSARTLLTSAVIGLIIIIGSYSIGSYIFTVINTAT